MVSNNLFGRIHHIAPYSICLILALALIGQGARAEEYGTDGTCSLYQDNDTVIRDCLGMTDGSNASVYIGQDVEKVDLWISCPLEVTVITDWTVSNWYMTLNITDGPIDIFGGKVAWNGLFHSTNSTNVYLNFVWTNVGMSVEETFYTFDFTMTCAYFGGVLEVVSDTPDHTVYLYGIHPGSGIVTYGELLENTLGGIGALILVVGPGYLWYVSKHEGTIISVSLAMVVMMIGGVFFYVFLLGGD